MGLWSESFKFFLNCRSGGGRLWGEGEVSPSTQENAGVEEKLELVSVGVLSWGREQEETWRKDPFAWMGSVWAFGGFGESAELRFQ